MQPYKNVYSLDSGRLIKNTENKIEHTDKNGQKRIKTNPTYGDLLKVGKYRLKELQTKENMTQGEVFYKIEGEYIVEYLKEE